MSECTRLELCTSLCLEDLINMINGTFALTKDLQILNGHVQSVAAKYAKGKT